MEYRKMKPSDIQGVYEVEVSAFSNPWTISALKSELNNKLANYIVAEDENGKILGYVGAWYILDEAHITNVAVHKDARGRKIANGLMENLIQECLKSKIDHITLEVRKSNIIAQNLYKKHGFKPEGVRTEYYQDNREDAIIMWKEIKAV
ncbi:ribosomal protein S18-alanine N-acetyltransferase [Peptostreptococcus faecalis]|uniref:ribosomal protein S18-alanine N-acetyltransferase n=1 Tax=Peptostreptococcus faecalis TaxID=2045015 RepID=UPI000C797D80|nr:ribosomal protein S18-alanine N-acetyltransferase [Peptostreptococcus faecalis]